MRINLYDKFTVVIPDDEWHFLCTYRWGTDSPEQEEVEAEFGVCGARKAETKEEVEEIIHKTVAYLKDVMEINGPEEGRRYTKPSLDVMIGVDKDGAARVMNQS